MCVRPCMNEPPSPWAGPPDHSTGRHWSTGGRVENPWSSGWGDRRAALTVAAVASAAVAAAVAARSTVET